MKEEKVEKNDFFKQIRLTSFFFWVLVSLIIAIPIYLFLGNFNLSAAQNDIITTILFYSVFVSWVWWLFKDNLKDLRFLIGNVIPKKNKRWILLLLIIIFIIDGPINLLYFYFVNQIFPSIFNNVDLSIINSPPAKDYFTVHIYPILLFLFTVILIPIIEEIVFRGIILHRLAVKWNRQIALLLTAFIFAILHIQFGSLLIISYIIGLLYLKVRSLSVTILNHMINNFIVYLASIAFFFDNKPDNLNISEMKQLPVFSIVWVALGLLAIYFIFKKIKPENPEFLPFYANQLESSS